jgi:hypothetical protein
MINMAKVTRPIETRKILKLIVILLFLSQIANAVKLREMVAADYNSRSGLEYDTRYYNGNCFIPFCTTYPNYMGNCDNGVLGTQACLDKGIRCIPMPTGECFGAKPVERTQSFYASRTLATNPSKNYNDTNLLEFYNDSIGWRVKAYADWDRFGEYYDYDPIVAMIPYVQATLTTKCDSAGNNCKKYGIEYLYDEHMNMKKIIDYGLIDNMYKEYVIEFPYTYLGSAFFQSGLNTSLTDFNGTLHVIDSTPDDVVITELTYVNEKFGIQKPPATAATKGDLYNYFNMVSFPEKTIVKGKFGEIVTYERNDFDLPSADYSSYLDGGAVPNYQKNNCWGNSYCLRGNIVSSQAYSLVGNDSSFTDGHIAASKVNEIIYVSDHYGNAINITQIGYSINASGKNSTVEKQVNITMEARAKAYAKEVKKYPYNLGIRKSANYSMFGAIMNVTDESGIMTNYRYDDLGRIKKIWQSPDTENDPSITYSYSTPQQTHLSPPWKINVTKKIDTGKYQEICYTYDGLGRLKSTLIKESGSTLIATGIKYNLVGNKESTTKPVRLSYTGTFCDYTATFPLYSDMTNAGALEMFYSYDYKNRLTQVTDYSGNSVVTTYKVQEKEVADQLGRIRSFSEDSKGNLILVEEPAP